MKIQNVIFTSTKIENKTLKLIIKYKKTQRDIKLKL